MRSLLLLILTVWGLQAGDLQFFIHTPGNTADGPAMGATYAFPDTPLGASSSVDLRLKNTSTTQVYLMRAVFSGDTSYAVDGSLLNNCLPAGGFQEIRVTFAPAALGSSTTPLQIAYMAYPVSSGCPATPPINVLTGTLATLSGNGIAPTLTTSVTIDSLTNPISSGSAISFGQVGIGATKAATFTVTNSTASTLPVATPAIVSSVFSQSPYSLGSLTTWPSSLAPGGTASFTLAFAPTQQALVTAALNFGSRFYPLNGTGIPGPGLESLLVSYTLPTGVHYNITTATPVDFGSVQTGSTASYIFSVSNPATNFASQTVPSISLSGVGFTLTSVPTLPVTLKPGDTTTFTVAFAPAQAGVQSSTLAIGTLQYTLSGKAVAPLLNPSIQVSPGILTSGQQAQVSVPLSSSSQAKTTGTLTLSFTSAVSGAADDPAIVFTSSGTRTAAVSFVTGASSGSFANGQSSLTFQTGTTAGTLKFTLSFASGQTVSKSVDITPTAVQIVSSSAAKQSPYLVISLSAYDNTYSSGKLLFNFYDTKGLLLTPGGISIDETRDFHNYFFLNNQAGGAFGLQAKFPITGDITTIGAADVMVQNANGQSQTQHLTF
jgi:hypothetical protein